jgi:tetratricopeptide (TPR) repeat protein
MIGGTRGIAALLASCLLASPALAEPKEVSEKDKQLASDLVKKAIARSQAGDHSAAIDIYLQAYTIVPNSALLSNIGAEFLQSGKQKEALRYFCMYIDKAPSGALAPYATSQAKSLQIQLGNKEVDDSDVCAPPKRRIEHPIDPPVIDDPPPPHRGNSSLRYGGFASGAVGLVALGVGVYAGLKAKDISDQITNHPPGMAWQDGIKALEARGQSYENLQIGMLIGGGVLVGLGVILVVSSGGSSEPSRDKVDKTTLHVTPTSNGVAVFGRF